MKANPIPLIALIVLLPLSLLGWAAYYIACHEQTIARQRLEQLMSQRLEEINGMLARHFDSITRDLRQITAIDEFDIDDLRKLTRSEPRFLQLFVLSPEGELRFPDPHQPLNDNERSFLARTSKMFTDFDLKTAAAVTDVQSDSQESKSSSLSEGWLIWYWDRGQHLIYWQRRSSGQLVGVALERARWMADLIGVLPETVVSTSYSSRRDLTLETGLRLIDANAMTIYQWGRIPTGRQPIEPLCEISVTAPLNSWRLQCVVAPENLNRLTGRGLQWSLWAGFSGVGLGLAALAFLLVRNYARDMREASQQVSFVNQVSHELKTPLTNIRMYADLLDRDLDGIDATEAEQPRRRLNVIVSEAERLSRLIGNVLTFARHRRQTLQPQPRSVAPGELILQIVDRFRPSLDALHIAVELHIDPISDRMLDPDFLEQILGNLVSNVEKYASGGGRLEIQASATDDRLSIRVADDGPGIPSHQREEIFLPFKRLNNEIRFAAGTGIGLTIARELARLHGGDVRLLESQHGCLFEVQLQCFNDDS